MNDRHTGALPPHNSAYKNNKSSTVIICALPRLLRVLCFVRLIFYRLRLRDRTVVRVRVAGLAGGFGLVRGKNVG